MKGQFTARTPLSLAAWDAGPEFEIEMVVTFTVQPGHAETFEEPGEDAFVEDIDIRLFDKAAKSELHAPKWLTERFAENGSFREWLLDEAHYQDKSARDDAAEMRHEVSHG